MRWKRDAHVDYLFKRFSDASFCEAMKTQVSVFYHRYFRDYLDLDIYHIV